MTEQGLPFGPVLIHRLHRTVKPFHRETVRSYLERLAVINKVPVRCLIRPSHWVTTSLNLPELLAVLCGRPLEDLHLAFPELAMRVKAELPAAEPSGSAWACRRCAARTGLDHPVRIWLAGENTQLCIRHKLWTGQGVQSPRNQFDLAHLPHVVEAQIRYDKLARRRGTRTSEKALHLCRRFVRKLANSGGGLATTDPRLRRYIGSDAWERETQYSPLRCAASFPYEGEAVALLTSLHWRSRILSHDEQDRASFMTEFHRHIPLGPPSRTTRELGWTRQLAEIAEEVERTGRRTGEQSIDGLDRPLLRRTPSHAR
jgi:hypothetical protein